MTFEMLLVFGLLALAVILFASERLTVDVVALLLLSVLLLSGIVTPEEGFSGFSNSATLTIAAMFVLSDGLRRTGALERASELFLRLGRENRWLALVVIMAVVSVISAFINNTAAVAIFIPVVLRVAGDLDMSPSKLLIPLSFAAMFGGVCTLVGTSTNILMSSIAEDHGLEPFSMFEFAPLGLVLLAAGFAYILLVAVPWLPERRKEGDLSATYGMNEYLTEIVLEPSFGHLGESFDLEGLSRALDCDVIMITKDGDDTRGPVELAAGDVLRVRGGPAEIDALRWRKDVSLKPPKEWYERDLVQGDDVLVEAVIAPGSSLESRRTREIELPERYGATLLAVRHRGELQEKRLEEVRLSPGDSLLMMASPERARGLERDPSFVLVSEVGVTPYRTSRLPFAIAVMVAVVAAAAFGLVPIVTSATVGSLLLILGGAISVDEAYDAINWKVIFLLAGVLPLGIAMEKTGAAQALSHGLLGLAGDWGPRIAVSGFFLLAVILTNVISNQATAVLLAPVAFQAAGELGIGVRPLLLAVTFAASLSFMTPVGYQTNTLIYGPGQYKFTDFVKIGTPLNLLVWLLASLLIPWLWPLTET